MRLIDAENIRIKPEFMHDVCGMAMIRVEDVVRILNEQSTIQPEPHWIPVTERLPEAENMYRRPTKRYLCQRESGGVRQFFVGARLCDPKGYLKDWWDWYGVKIHNAEVVAYMPLPEPFKGVTT